MAREITNINNFNLQEDLPNDFLKAVQFFTLLDLVLMEQKLKVLLHHLKTVPLYQALFYLQAHQLILKYFAAERHIYNKHNRQFF